jgi:hypothetical protein
MRQSFCVGVGGGRFLASWIAQPAWVRVVTPGRSLYLLLLLLLVLLLSLMKGLEVNNLRWFSARWARDMSRYHVQFHS